MVELDRKKLYKEVWEVPLVKLGPKYGMTDQGLRKICKKLNVPTPPLGYWTKVQYNIRVEKPKLPKLKPGQQSSYTIQKDGTHKSDKEKIKFSDEGNELISKFESDKSIKAPKTLSSPHILVLKTRTILPKLKPNDYGVLNPRRYESLDICVNRKTQNRALTLINGLIKFFRRKGYEILIEKEYYEFRTYLKIFGEKIPIRIREPSIRRDHELTVEEQKKFEKRGYVYAPKYDYTPSEELIFEIDSYASGVKRYWRDGKKRQLEDLFKDIIVGLVKYADLKRASRIEWEEAQRRREEEWQRQAELERQRKIELERRQDLERQAEMWVKSRQIREYVKAVEDKLSGEVAAENDQQLKGWLKWARDHADRIDPLKGPFHYAEKNIAERSFRKV